MEVKHLGNIYGEKFGKGYEGNVWEKQGICPTLTTTQGGGREPMIIEDAQAIRMVRTEEGKALRKEYESGAIHHGFNEHREMELRTDGVSNTLSTVQKDNYICEKSIVAMRGRNPENPSDRTVGSPTEQRLEPNSQGICNTLTSVQKDNLVMEVKQLGFMDNGTGQHQSNTVYDENALCPNITTIEGGGTQQIKVMTETVHIKQATSKGYIECEVGGVADLSFPESKTRRGRVQEKGQVSPTLMAGEQDICRIENQYRIRKLTPLSCWRLMDFTDEDFEKAAQVNSNTQLYKQAGNSIVKNVLVAIIGQMLPGKENIYKEN